MLKKIFGFCIIFMLLGCSGIDVKRYTDNRPELDLYTYFLGSTKGWGIVQDRGGKLLRQFVVDIHGTLNEKKELVLQEDFVWSDGEITDRTWVIGRETETTYYGKAGDVTGRARGESAGNALNWQYHLNLEVDGSVWEIHFDDWMFLQPDDVLINKAAMSKFGFHVGEITIVFQKN